MMAAHEDFRNDHTRYSQGRGTEDTQEPRRKTVICMTGFLVDNLWNQANADQSWS